MSTPPSSSPAQASHPVDAAATAKGTAIAAEATASTAPTPAAQTAPPRGGIVAQGLRRSFGDVHAVRNMSITAPAGQVTALVGPNGSGKTTLLLMLASLLKPDAGSITVDGLDLAADPRAARARLGWMPDTLGVWDALTTTEILVSVGRLYGLDKSEATTRAAELLHLVRLPDFAHRPARVLSRGQQQRLSLARALVHDPAVLLLDEPASGLDPDSRLELRDILRSLAREGRAVLVSSHDLGELDEFSDRAVFVAAGETVREQSVVEADAAERSYTVRSLEPAALEQALTRLGVPHTAARDDRRAARSVLLSSEADAAALLSALVAEGVPVVGFAPTSGALEETYRRTVGAAHSTHSHAAPEETR